MILVSKPSGGSALPPKPMCNLTTLPTPSPTITSSLDYCSHLPGLPAPTPAPFPAAEGPCEILSQVTSLPCSEALHSSPGPF